MTLFGIHIAVAGATYYHQGSADFLDDRLVHRNVDYFLCGIASRGFTPRYVERILRRLSPESSSPLPAKKRHRPKRRGIRTSPADGTLPRSSER